MKNKNNIPIPDNKEPLTCDRCPDELKRGEYITVGDSVYCHRCNALEIEEARVEERNEINDSYNR